MAVEVIVMGARGRMGATLIRLIAESPDLRLAGAVGRPGNCGGLERLGCPVSETLDGQTSRQAVVLDFTSPEATLATARMAAARGNPVVVGTTGLTSGQVAELAEAARTVPVFQAPNMSPGVHALLAVLPRLVQALGPAYDMEMVEIHHRHKADAPSGTALKLARCLAEARGRDYDAVKRHGRDGLIGPRPGEEIGVQALRGGDVVGDHTLFFLGPGERIEITHRAHSQETFAQGALRAARWLAGQNPGRLYGMADLFEGRPEEASGLGY